MWSSVGCFCCFLVWLVVILMATMKLALPIIYTALSVVVARAIAVTAKGQVVIATLDTEEKTKDFIRLLNSNIIEPR